MTPQERAGAIEAALSWALDIMDMYDRRLAGIDGEARVYCATHVAGKAQARDALTLARELVQELESQESGQGDGRLLPCPFCGGEATTVRAGTPRQSAQVECTECGCHLESNENGYGAAWNRRSLSPAKSLPTPPVTGSSE